MAQWTIGRRLIFGFGFLLLIMLSLGGFTALQLVSIRAEAHSMAASSLPAMELASEFERHVQDAYALTAKHIFTTSAEPRVQIEEKMADAKGRITRILGDYEKLITSPEDRQHFEAVDVVRTAFLKTREEVLALSRAGRRDDAVARFNTAFEAAYESYLQVVDEMRAWRSGENTAAAAQIDAHVTSTVVATVVGISLALVLGSVIGALLTRGVNRVLGEAVLELRQGAEHVVAAAGQVATSAQDLSHGATEQAASLEETSASMEEMASMTRTNAESTNQVSGVVEEISRLAKDSHRALTAMVGAMDRIGESSSRVSKIIKTIDQIAFQTNILALNAAVEAARAGEAGMGFAVVADEVRNLAQRSAQAARDTAALIEESVANVQSGIEQVREVNGSVSAITDGIGHVKELVANVNLSSRQQKDGTDQIAQAIAQMERVTQSTAATAEESAAAAEELNAQAENTARVIRDLEALVGAGASSPADASSRALSGGKVAVFAPRQADKAPGRNPQALTAEDTGLCGKTGTFGAF